MRQRCIRARLEARIHGTGGVQHNMSAATPTIFPRITLLAIVSIISVSLSNVFSFSILHPSVNYRGGASNHLDFQEVIKKNEN